MRVVVGMDDDDDDGDGVADNGRLPVPERQQFSFRESYRL